VCPPTCLPTYQLYCFSDSASTDTILPPSYTEQMTTLILKHAKKNRLGAVEWGRTTSMCAKATAVSVEYFCQCRRRKGVRGSGQSLLANMNRRHTVAAIQRRASKRWPILKRSGYAANAKMVRG